MAVLVMHAEDTWPPGRVTLEQVNPLTGKLEPIDLATAVKVTVLIKGALGALKERVCTGPNGGGIKTATGAKKGQIEWYWLTGDLVPAAKELYSIEWEIEYAESAGVKRYQTVSNEGYYEMEVLKEWFQGVAVGATLVMKQFDTAPTLKGLLEENGKPLNLKTSGPEGTAAKSVTAYVFNLLTGEIIASGVCTGEAGAAIGTVTNGVVERAWGQNDLKIGGVEYGVVFVVEYNETELGHTGTKVPSKQTIPNNGYFKMRTVAQLGTA